AIHLVNLATNEDITVADASNAQFSSDSKWLTYQIEIQPTPPARGRPSGDSAAGADTANRNRPAGSTQVQRRTELRELATGKVQSWQDIQTATFSPTATHLLLRRRPPTPAGGAGAAGGGGGPGGGGPGGFGGGGAGGAVRATDAL